MVPWAKSSQPPNSISIDSAVSAWHIRMTTDQHTDRQTMLRVTSVATGRICAMPVMWPNNAYSPNHTSVR